MYSVSLSKGGGGTQILKISKKGGVPEKQFWGGRNQKGGNIFKNKGRGTQLFKLNLGIKKEQKWGLLDRN